MARYRKSWTMPNTGWMYRLDIIPYDDTLAGTLTELNSATVIIPEDGLGNMTRGFDATVPIGLCVDATQKITFVYDNLPSALKTYLKTKEVGGERNTFLLFSDRGTSGATYTLEGVFVQAGIGGKKYKYVEGATLLEVELMDAAYWVLTDTTAETVFGGLTSTSSLPYYDRLYEVGFPSVAASDAYHDLRNGVATDIAHRFQLQSWATVMESMTDIVCNEYVNKSARTANALDVAQFNAFDVSDNLHSGLFNCIGLKTALDSATRSPSVALDKDTLYVITHIWGKDNSHNGGLYASQDERGWARYESMRDLMQDLAESSNGKLYYNHAYNVDAVNGDYLSLTWYWVPIGGDRTNDTAAATLDMSKAVEDPETDEMDVKIGKAEVRFETNSSDDITETVINTGASRGSRSFNTQCMMTNAPVVKPDANNDDGDSAGGLSYYQNAISIGLFQTNMYCYLNGTQPFKVHEYTKIHDRFATSTEYSDAHFQTVPSSTDSTQLQAQYKLWVQEAQSVGCLHYALADSLARVLGHDNVGSITLTWKHSDYGANVLGDSLGRLHNLTGAQASSATEYAWDKAVVSEMDIDWTNGTTKITYLLMAA